MSSGVQVSTATVLRHAAVVDELAAQMATARSAVREVTMSHQAYGELCQFLPGLLSPLFGGAVEVLNGAVDALSETAIKLRAAAGALDATDAGNARQVSGS